MEDQLCNASARGNLADVKQLLQNGANVNGFNMFKRTALQVAQTGHVGLLLELLLAGANPDLADPACGLTVLHDASRDGFVDSVKTLLENGADANKVDSSGNLPLHLAAKEGHLDVVQLLIWRTANPRQRNKQGATAFQLASSTGKAKTARYLQEYRPLI